MANDNAAVNKSVPLYEAEVRDFLAANLSALNRKNLRLIQTEYPVRFGTEQGRIDILAQDEGGEFVVIEVKRGVAGKDAVAQVQSYMGALMDEHPGAKVSGVLVASDIDGPGQSALKVTNVQFFEFQTYFKFSRRSITRSTAAPTDPEAADYRHDYWERMGGVITHQTFRCANCQKMTRVALVGTQRLCGLCGKQTS